MAAVSCSIVATEMVRLNENRGLLEGFRRGDEDALGQVYREYVPRLVAFLHRGLSFKSGDQQVSLPGCTTAHEMQDVVQETFFRAFGERARQSYDGLRPYENYLFTIARNLLVDRARGSEHRHEHRTFDEAAHAADGETSAFVTRFTDPGQRVVNDELAALIEQFEATLSQDEARVLKARFREGLSQRSAADQLGITRMRVRVLEERLKNKALAVFEGSGYLESLAKVIGAAQVLALLLGGMS